MYVWGKKKRSTKRSFFFINIFSLLKAYTVLPNPFFFPTFFILHKHVFYSPTRDIFLNDEETGILCKGILRAALTILKLDAKNNNTEKQNGERWEKWQKKASN